MTFTEFLKIEESAEAVTFIRSVLGDAGLAFPTADELATVVEQQGGRSPVEVPDNIAIAIESAAVDFRNLFEKFKSQHSDGDKRVDFI